jgi:hypothetical protein
MGEKYQKKNNGLESFKGIQDNYHNMQKKMLCQSENKQKISNKKSIN